MKYYIFLFSLFLVVLITIAPAQNPYPPKPLKPELIDIPGDGGNNIYIRWKHFATVPGIKYYILRSVEGGEFEKVTPLQVKTASPVLENKPYNDFTKLDYYIYLEPRKDDVPIAHVVRMTPENKESLLAMGAQKINRVELEVPPKSMLNELPNVFAEGNYYLVIPDSVRLKKLASEKVPMNIWTQFGFKLPYEGPLTVELLPSKDELEFFSKGLQIIEENDVPKYLLYKYCKRIVSLVTDSARYTVKYDMMSFFHRSSKEIPIEPGKHYVYKLRLMQVEKPIKKVFEDSDTAGITPKDEAPIPPNNITALYDSARKELVIDLYYRGFYNVLFNAKIFDTKTYSIYRTTPEDTAREKGELLAKISASWRNVKLSGINPDDKIYILVDDSSGQTTKTDFLKFKFASAESLVLPPGLHVKDKENDEGKKAVVRWGPPTLAVKYSVENPSPNLKTDNVESKNLYFTRQNGGTLFVATDTTKIPSNAQKVVNIIYPVPLDKLKIRVSYELWTNYEDKALYGEFSLDGRFAVDKDYTGERIFENIPQGVYELKGDVVTSSGKTLKNPEAVVKIKVDATKIHSTKFNRPDYFYRFYRGTDPEDLSTFVFVGDCDGYKREFVDNYGDVSKAKGKFYYIVQMVGSTGWITQSEPLGPISPTGDWFNTQKTVIAIAVIIFVGIALYFIYHGKKGKDFYIRPIAGLVHIDEALGRATEMGRPIIYVTGLGTIGDIATISSLTILAKVARMAAEYQTRVIVPCYDPVVMIVAQETVKNAFMDAGRPDLYREEDIFYIAAAQFAYAAAVSGLMIREKTAANFFMGRFFAESLILAETGASTGAIQVAGTDDMTQLPFFITACDYTLIGEELYAASAYLSKDPMQKGTIKAQDFLKAIEVILLVLGIAAATGGMWWFTNIFRAIGTE